MDDRRLVKTSRYLSLCLRHHPERLGLAVERGGWVRVDDLLRACAEHGFALTMDDLREVVERNDKRRFAYADEWPCRSSGPVGRQRALACLGDDGWIWDDERT